MTERQIARLTGLILGGIGFGMLLLNGLSGTQYKAKGCRIFRKFFSAFFAISLGNASAIPAGRPLPGNRGPFP